VQTRGSTTLAVYALAGLATLGLAGTCAAHYVGSTAALVPADANRPPPRAAQLPVRLANSGGGSLFSFFEGLFGAGPQTAPRRPRAPEYRRAPPRSVPQELSPPPAPGGEAAVATYRTMCVRLCDGYYWPVSFATSMDRFGRDAQTCARSCGTPVALYYYPNPGGAPEDMVSLDGQPYRSLGTAFLYRASYDASCKCRAHPWEAAAIERHKGYAKSGEMRAAARGRRRSR
jgi:uncharacterized protein DUF2865